MTWGDAALIAATVTTGLSAGLFYSYACSVMPGLRRAEDKTLVQTMQRINVAILNPWFALIFGGPVVFAALALLLHLGEPELPWIIAGLVLYVVQLAVTFVKNIPLNNALEAAGDTDPAAARAAFEEPWVRWNLVRTVANTAAFVALAAAPF